jgi:hypothetical protein
MQSLQAGEATFKLEHCAQIITTYPELVHRSSITAKYNPTYRYLLPLAAVFDGNFLLLRSYHGEHGPKVPVTLEYIALQRVLRKWDK